MSATAARSSSTCAMPSAAESGNSTTALTAASSAALVRRATISFKEVAGAPNMAKDWSCGTSVNPPSRRKTATMFRGFSLAGGSSVLACAAVEARRRKRTALQRRAEAVGKLALCKRAAVDGKGNLMVLIIKSVDHYDSHGRTRVKPDSMKPQPER